MFCIQIHHQGMQKYNAGVESATNKSSLAPLLGGQRHQKEVILLQIWSAYLDLSCSIETLT